MEIISIEKKKSVFKFGLFIADVSVNELLAKAPGFHSLHFLSHHSLLRVLSRQ